MIDFAIAFIAVSAAVGGFMFGFLAIVEPAAIPWGERGRAARQIKAMREWYNINYSVLHPLKSRAEGYFVVRDYIGVESAYIAARRIVDGEVAP